MGEQKMASSGGGSGDALYALGIFGAAVFFWRRADGPKGKALAILKGVVWPAFLVYEAFSLLEGEAGAEVAEAIGEVAAGEPI
jgi:hypothetical protein